MIYIDKNITILEKEIKEEFVRSSGPGGQNVNKVATAVQCRFNVRLSNSLPADVKERLFRIAGNRINDNGELIIKAQRYRTQRQNRQDAINRLTKLILDATIKPKKRRLKKISLIAKQKRLETKRKQSEKKARRRFNLNPDS